MVEDISPILLLYYFHFKNFGHDVREIEQPPRVESRNSPITHSVPSNGSADSNISDAIDNSNNCGLLGANVQKQMIYT